MTFLCARAAARGRARRSLSARTGEPRSPSRARAGAPRARRPRRRASTTQQQSGSTIRSSRNTKAATRPFRSYEASCRWSPMGCHPEKRPPRTTLPSRRSDELPRGLHFRQLDVRCPISSAVRRGSRYRNRSAPLAPHGLIAFDKRPRLRLGRRIPLGTDRPGQFELHSRHLAGAPSAVNCRAPLSVRRN